MTQSVNQSVDRPINRQDNLSWISSLIQPSINNSMKKNSVQKMLENQYFRREKWFPCAYMYAGLNSETVGLVLVLLNLRDIFGNLLQAAKVDKARLHVATIGVVFGGQVERIALLQKVYDGQVRTHQRHARGIDAPQSGEKVLRRHVGRANVLQLFQQLSIGGIFRCQQFLEWKNDAISKNFSHQHRTKEFFPISSTMKERMVKGAGNTRTHLCLQKLIVRDFSWLLRALGSVPWFSSVDGQRRVRTRHSRRLGRWNYSASQTRSCGKFQDFFRLNFIHDSKRNSI